MKKISSKIIIAIIGCCFTVSLLLGNISIFRSSEFIKKEASDKLVYMAKNYANEFNGIILTVESTLNTLSSTIKATIDLEKLKDDPEYMENYLETFIAPIIKKIPEEIQNAQVLGAYFYYNPELTGRTGDVWYADLEGKGDFQRQEQLGLEVFDPNSEDMEWFYGNTKEKNGRWGDPYIWDSIDFLITPYTISIYSNDTLLGVAGMDIRFDEIKKNVENMKVYDTGYAFLLNNDYDVLIHPTINQGDNFKTVNNGELKTLTEEMEKKRSGFIEYKFKGQNKITGYSRLSNGWIIAIAPPLNEIFKGINKLKNLLNVLMILGIIISSLIALYLGKSISKPITKVTQLINKTANLDLAYDSTYEPLLKYKDETGIMTESLFNARKVLGEIVEHIARNSKNIDSQAENLSAVSEEMSSSSENVANTILDVAKGTGSQAEDLANITSILNQFSKKLSSIVNTISDIEVSSREVKSMADESGNEMQALIESVNKATNSFNDFVVQISQLGQNINEINEITNVINNISDQTNLLALNASIEAARAGEAGKGFAVVAEEIRKLAEQSKSSAESINSLINNISKDTNVMLKTTDTMDSELNNQAAVINTTIDSFKKIIKSIDEIIPQIETANVNAVSIDSEKNTILEKIEGISSVAVEFSASSEEIAASSGEMNASTEEVASAANTLSSMTTEMMEQVNKFKL